ncbi:hypothetical protein [Streptomyces sp. NPDC047841]
MLLGRGPSLLDPEVSREQLDVTLVEPQLVVEVGVDVARDACGR